MTTKGFSLLIIVYIFFRNNNAKSSRNTNMVVNRNKCVSLLGTTMDGITAEEQLRIADEVEMFLEAESSTNNTTNEGRKKATRATPDMFEDTDFETYDFDNIDNIEPVPKLENKSHETIQFRDVQSKKDIIDLTESLDSDDDDVFNNIDLDAHLNLIDNQAKQSEQLNIARLLEKKNNKSKGVFRIKAKFKSIAQKLGVQDNEWCLKIFIEDKSGEMLVIVHSDIVANLAECLPSKLTDLQPRISSNDISAQEMVVNVKYSYVC